jgi:hypothetical protein
MIKSRTGSVLKPEQFDELSKETVINFLGNAVITFLDLQTPTIIKLSPIITKVQIFTVFNILNRIDKQDGLITICYRTRNSGRNSVCLCYRLNFGKMKNTNYNVFSTNKQ